MEQSTAFLIRGHMNKKIKLSIGMIVKNEEENLERCLIALLPLMKAVPSELIIADTGSADRTVEIAQAYTEKVCFFDWCDDFAKAKNYVLEKAEGEWFLNIDADEWFEKVDLIIDFLNSSEEAHYNDACFIIRNFGSYSRSSDYTEEYIKRLFRILPGRRFEGIVHEHVKDAGKLKYIDEHIYHYGYVQDRGSLQKKNKRNLPLLMKELEKEPDNLLMLYQLAQEYLSLDDKDKIEDTCSKIINKYGSDINNYYVIKARWMVNHVHMLRGDYESIKKFTDDYLRDNQIFYNIKIMDVLCQCIDVHLRIKDYEKVNQLFERLFMFMAECDDRIEEGEEGFGASAWVREDAEREKRTFQYALSLFKCRRFKESFLYLKRIKGILGERLLDENTELWNDILTETENYEELCDYYCKIKSIKGKAGYVKKIILHLWDENTVLAKQTAKYFLEQSEEDEFVRLQTLYFKAEEKEPVSIEEFESLLSSIAPDKEYSRLIYLAQKYEVPIYTYIERCQADDIAGIAYRLIETYPLFKEVVISHIGTERESGSMKEEFLYLKMTERLLFDIHLTEKRMEDLFDCYIRAKIHYLSRFIKAEMLTEQECDNLPGEYCFAVYSSFALTCYEKKDYKNSMSYYRRALTAWPFMKDIIKIKTNRMKNEIDREIQERQEFEQYAVKIKQYIWSLIQQKNDKLAAETLTAYAKVNPSDKEIEIIRQRLNVE